MVPHFDTAKKSYRWPTKCRGRRTSYPVNYLGKLWKPFPARRLRMKRMRLWVRNRFGAVL